MEIIRCDNQTVVCVKPAGVLSTDEPGGLPEKLRTALGDPAAPLYTVHRLDRAVGGAMLLARTRHAASDLGRQVMDGRFRKEYLAVVHGAPEAERGMFADLLLRDKAARVSRVVPEAQPGAQEAVLDYAVLARSGGLSLVRVTLRTGRTHQIRVQFSSRGLPLVGDRKYGAAEDGCPIALWSWRLAFDQPKTGERIEVESPPPEITPWTVFERDRELWNL